ncbi:MAG: type II toxin-antitoxin system RelE/ParE family toxin [Thermodesulfobacteriota bacterium]
MRSFLNNPGMKQTTYNLRVPDEVAELVRKMHPHLKKKIKASLKAILSDPNSGKALKDELAGLRSFRVSRFRIVYRISQKREIEVVAIGPRKRIYEETFWILNKMEKSEE